MSIAEIQRLSALRSTGVLDTPPEDGFDRLTELAAALFDAPIALVSLIDEERQWFKSRVGLDATETPRAWAFCDHAIKGEPRSTFIVEDARADGRFAKNPPVTGDPNVRFYIGATLTSDDGHNLGTLCVIDTKPRPKPAVGQIDQLKILARMVVDGLELNRARRAVAEQQRLLEMAETVSGVGHWRLDVADGRITWSDEVYRIHGVGPATFDPNLDEGIAFYHPDDQAEVLRLVNRGLFQGEDYAFQLRLLRKDGELRNVTCKATVELDAKGATIAMFGVFQDVTDQVCTLQKVERSEKRYRLLTENANDIVTEMDRQGRFTYVSPAVTRLLGYPEEDVVGKDGMVFIHGDDHERVRAAFKAGLQGSGGWQIECRAICKDGRVIWVEARPRIVRDRETGTIIAVTDVIRDITDRKAAEEKLAESESRYRLMTENANDLVTQMDWDGVFTYVSPAITPITGYTVEEVVGQPAIDLIHPDDHKRIQAEFAAAFEGPIGWRLEYRIICKDGRVIWVEARPTIIKDQVTGRYIAATDVIRDITTRKAGEEALALSESRYRLLADNAQDMIARMKPGGEIMFVSPGCYKTIGYHPDELIGLRTVDMMHPDDQPSVTAYYADLISRGPDAVSEPFQFRALHKDGHWVWLEGQPKIFFDPETGEQAAVQDVVRDVTRRKEMETELRHARAAAEAATAVKSEFLANMSHELRTPLTSILGFAKLLSEQAEISEEGRRYIERVSDGSQALLTTVNDILDFSKLEAGQVEISLRPVDPTAIIKSALELLAPQANAKGLQQRFEAAQLPALVLADDTRIRQILLNLISNAVKFTERGGVTVTARYDEVMQRLRCEVVDTGLGVPPDRLDRLFKRFSQVDASTTRSHGGTGLGLAICKGLAEAMGGSVGATSVVGQGSCFWLELPCAIPVPAKTTAGVSSHTLAAVAATCTFEGLRVLIADDNAINRELVRIILTPFDVEVTEAPSGADAIRLAQSAPFDIILMDVRMPGIDGPAAAAEIRAGGGPNAKAPIIAFTAEANDRRLPAEWVSIFDDQLPKPIIAADLINTIEVWNPANPDFGRCQTKCTSVTGWRAKPDECSELASPTRRSIGSTPHLGSSDSW